MPTRDRELPRYDVVCIGGGTAGMTAARAARQRGASVALVERGDALGGDCTFWGCVPSKALIEVARTAHRARELSALGFGEPVLDFGRVMERQREIVAAIAHDERAELFERDGIAVLNGNAAFTAPGLLEIDGRPMSAGRIVLATGSAPVIPPIPGLREADPLTNESIFTLERQPRRLLVLGGGPIGLELAQAFRRFGSNVAVIEMQDRLMAREDHEVAPVVEAALRGEGIDLHLGTTVERVEHGPDEHEVTLVGTGPQGAPIRERGDALLVAIGRRPGADTVGLDRAGVATDERGFVRVDDAGRTSAPGIYAAGDVTGGLMFTHVAAHEGRVAGVNAAGGNLKADYRVVPWITFTDPEVARVGLTEAEARERHGDAVEVATFPMRSVDRARIGGDEQGFVKLVTHRRGLLGRASGGRLVGAHIVGESAGELVHEAVMAMQSRMFTGRLAQAIHAYPSMSMGVQQAAAQLFPEARVLAPVEDDAWP